MTRRWVIAVMVMILALGACGGDDTKTSDAVAGTSTSTTAMSATSSTSSTVAGEVHGGTTNARSAAAVGLCAEANVTCVTWAEALKWWKYDEYLRRYPQPSELGMTEVVAALTASGDGLASDPNAATSLLLVAYAPPSGLSATSAKALYASGAIVMQVRIAPARAQENAKQDSDLEDDGHTVERIKINGRDAIFEEMTKQTGITGYRLWWSDDVDDHHSVLVEVLANSEVVSKDRLLHFADGLAKAS